MLKKVLSHPGHGNSKCCIGFSGMFHLSSKRAFNLCVGVSLEFVCSTVCFCGFPAGSPSSPPAIKIRSVTTTLDSMTDILLLLKIFNAGDTELYV